MRPATAGQAAPRGAPASRGARLGLIALAAVALVALVLGTRGSFDSGASRSASPAKTAGAKAKAVVPAVAPVSYLSLPPDEVRKLNAAIPFAAVANPPARPFAFVGTVEDKERAVTCLASAVYYEAGDDDIGGRAVAQVVLNRLRHPAFPHTVCGVVFQGAERQTGCQFTFTCDGALARVPQPAAWVRARGIAERALDGAVFAPVGNSTHYHTDWVLPNWSPEMDKIVEIHTHLFFRWRGWWGLPGAFREVRAGTEAIDPRIAGLARLGATSARLSIGDEDDMIEPVALIPPTLAGMTSEDFKKNMVRLADEAAGTYLLQLDPAAFPGSYAVLAWRICEGKAPCRVLGWRDRKDIPAGFPLQGAWRSTLSFSFEKDAAGGNAAYWNCNQMHRDNPSQCLPRTEGAVQNLAQASPIISNATATR